MLTGTAISTSYSNVASVVLLSCLTMVSGHDLIVTEDTITSLSDNFVEEMSCNHVTKFPAICEPVPTNCEPFLLPYVNDIVVLIPSIDPLKHLEFANDSIKLLNKLSLTKCFRFLRTGNSLTNDLYVLCLKNQTHETTIVTYLIVYSEDLTPTWYQYGNEYGTHVDLDSPLIVISSNFTGPEVLYVATIGGNAKLYIKHLRAGGDAVSVKSLPNACTSPELKHLYQLYALLKCSNGFVHIYDAFIGEFTKLPDVQGVTMIGRCANSSSSFVMITHQGNILLNKTASEPLRSIPFFMITVNSHQLDIILSFACHWNGSSTQLYFTTSQGDGMIYYLSVSLEHIAKSTVTEAHQMLKFPTTHIPSYTLQPSIVGSAWITELTDEGNNVQERVFINIKTGAFSRRPSNGLAYLISYADKPFHSHDQPDIIKPEKTESEVKDSNGLAQYIIIILIIGCFVTVVVIITLLIVICKLRRPRPRVLDRRHRPIELEQVQPETYSRISEETEISVLADTSFNNEGEIPLENQSTNEAESHSQAATDSNSQTAPDSNPQIVADSNSQTAADFDPLTSIDSYPQTATDSHSHGIENTTNSQAQFSLENQLLSSEFVPSEEDTSPPQQFFSTRGQQVVTGALHEPGIPHDPAVPNGPRGHDSDDETSGNDP